MMTEKRVAVPIKLVGHYKRTPDCLSENCPQRQECASHTTASDFRTESGFTPSLYREHDGTWTCGQEETLHIGALIWSNRRKRYESYDLYDDDQ